MSLLHWRPRKLLHQVLQAQVNCLARPVHSHRVGHKPINPSRAITSSVQRFVSTFAEVSSGTVNLINNPACKNGQIASGGRRPCEHAILCDAAVNPVSPELISSLVNPQPGNTANSETKLVILLACDTICHPYPTID